MWEVADVALLWRPFCIVYIIVNASFSSPKTDTVFVVCQLYLDQRIDGCVQKEKLVEYILHLP